MNIIISESQLRSLVKSLCEGVTFNSTGTKQHPTLNMTIDSNLDDESNKVVNSPQPGKNQMNMDTRLSNYPNVIRNSKENGMSVEEQTMFSTYGGMLMHLVSDYAKSSGKTRLNLDSFISEWSKDNRMTSVVMSYLKRLLTKAEVQIEDAEKSGDYKKLYDWAFGWMNENVYTIIRNANLYQRAIYKTNPDFNNGKIPTYQVGYVPGTRIKVISLFKFNNFNISDAIKNGTVRQNRQITSYVGNVPNENNKIPVTYDNGIKANVYNNFSKDEKVDYSNGDHFKKTYGLNDENYTSVTQFIDKSIMYAAYALKKEKYSPDFIVAAPSSSQFNKLYSTALANKLGTAKYVDGFFQRNLINFTDETGQIISERMRKDGVNEKLISNFQTTMKGVAMEEMAAEVAAPIRKLVSDYYEHFTDIAKAPKSREKLDSRIIERLLASYFYEYMIRDSNSLLKTGEVGKYLLNKFESSDKYLYRTDKYVAEQVRKRIAQKIGKKVFIAVIDEMWQIVRRLDKELKGQGYKLIFTNKFKIANLPRKLRPYLENIYVVADKNFNENHELFKQYRQGKFLIIDDDMNSGASLKSMVFALDDVVPDESPDKIMCLVNAYYGGGF